MCVRNMNERKIKYVFSEHLLRQADKNPAVKGRASLTHELIKSYGLLQHMDVLRPRVCNSADLRGFHNSDYVKQFERYVNMPKQKPAKEPDADYNSSDTEEEFSVVEEFGLGFDCPTWPNIKDYVCAIAGATMSACDALCKNAMLSSSSAIAREIYINWTGGWHHAHRDKASGYCYVNDIVLGILVLSKHFRRTLYIDLDVHHGDGVQEAFETTKRIFTLSFHQYECGFYPGTGSAEDCGFGGGKGYAVNFPYKIGITGSKFKDYFKRVTSKILERYQPNVCVIQCGADVLVGDPLGGTNLTPANLIDCISYVLKRNMPTVLLGGGGYNFTNASRYWTQLTAALCGQPLNDDIPDENTDFLKYGPDYSLNITQEKHIKDLNTEDYLEECLKIIYENLDKYNVTAV